MPVSRRPRKAAAKKQAKKRAKRETAAAQILGLNLVEVPEPSPLSVNAAEINFPNELPA